MSNFLAVATVTAALSEVLQAAIGPDVSGAVVTTVRPDSNGAAPQTGVNVYLYQVMTNAALNNMDLPTRRSNGELAERPRTALDLHYLLTFYGDEGNLEPQRLLGSAVRALHARPILTRDLIRQTIAKTKYSFLANSNLADAVESVRFTPLSLSLEELSKLWSVYFQTPYSLSVAYAGGAVLIETEDLARSALPVLARNIYVAPFRQPLIDSVTSADGAGTPILASSTVVLSGRQLRGDLTRIGFGDITVTPLPEDVGDARITVKLPVDLFAGVQGLQVIQQRLIGTPPAAHRGVESNLGVFVLRPAIAKKPDDTPDISVSSITIATGGTRSGSITAKVRPAIGMKQGAALLLNEMNPPADRAPRAYRFDAMPRNPMSDPPATETLVFPFTGVAAGDYLARVQVDGADSPLEQDANTANPVFVGPKVTIP